MNPEHSNALRDKIRNNPKLCPELSHLFDGSREIAELEPNPEYVSLAKARLQEANSQCFIIRVEAVRQRLLDEDNSCEKFLVDQCRYFGLIPDDNPTLTKIEVSQRKCAEGEAEHVEITIERLG